MGGFLVGWTLRSRGSGGKTLPRPGNDVEMGIIFWMDFFGRWLDGWIRNNGIFNEE